MASRCCSKTDDDSYTCMAVSRLTVAGTDLCKSVNQTVDSLYIWLNATLQHVIVESFCY
jgi:hypothetical protein